MTAHSRQQTGVTISEYIVHRITMTEGKSSAQRNMTKEKYCAPGK